MAKKIKCPRFGCGSTDVEYLSGNQKTTLNLNPLHPFTLVNTKPKGKQTFRCKSVGQPENNSQPESITPFYSCQHKAKGQTNIQMQEMRTGIRSKTLRGLYEART
nr:MAG TPA: hypothetical protein [Caudoviricetes sp.]